MEPQGHCFHITTSGNTGVFLYYEVKSYLMQISKKGKGGKKQKFCFKDNILKEKNVELFNKLKEKYLLADR